MIHLILSAIIILILCAIWYKNRNFANYVNRLPGPPAYPIFGNTLRFICIDPADLWKQVRKYSNKYYPIYRMWRFNSPIFNILAPEDIEVILKSSKHLKKSDIYDKLQYWLGTGLLTSSGEKWKNRRKILSMTFHFSILQKFYVIFQKHSKLFIDRLQEESNQPYTNVEPLVSEFTLHALCETAMGIRLHEFEQKEMFKEYLSAIYRMGELLIHRLFRPWNNIELIYRLTPAYKEFTKTIKTLHNFTNNVISQRESNMKNNPKSIVSTNTKKSNFAMLDLLLSVKHDTNTIDTEGIREEVDTFMFEGHDTTSACISFTLLMLANNRDIQDKIYREIVDVFHDLSKDPTIDEINRLDYLKQVIQESLRMYPSVPFISRITDSEVELKSKSFVIPSNSVTHIHIYDLHHNEDIYPDSYKFDPDRFSPENVNKRHPFAYIPFSAGSRNCIGKNFALLEIKVVLSEIIKNFILEPVDKPSDIVFITHLVLRSQRNVRVRFRKRT